MHDPIIHSIYFTLSHWLQHFRFQSFSLQVSLAFVGFRSVASDWMGFKLFRRRCKFKQLNWIKVFMFFMCHLTISSQTTPCNSLSAAHHNARITSIHTDLILSSWIDFDGNLLNYIYSLLRKSYINSIENKIFSWNASRSNKITSLFHLGLSNLMSTIKLKGSTFCK